MLVENNYNVSVFSSEGRLVLKQQVANNNYIDLKVASGLYLVKIETENNQSLVKKILVN